jgi:hypothetical protein
VKTLHYQSARGSLRPGDLRPNMLALSTLLIPDVACTSSALQRSRSCSHSNADQAHCLVFTDRGSGICSARTSSVVADLWTAMMVTAKNPGHTEYQIIEDGRKICAEKATCHGRWRG